MLSSKLVFTPSYYTTRLHKHLGSPLSTENTSSYRRLIGRLIYLTNTKPDITYVVQHLNQFVVEPISAHQQAASIILRYIKGSLGVGIFLSTNNNIHLKGFSDSYWVDCLDTKRSITGYAIYICNSLISWKSKKQTTVSRSSWETEYRALTSATCELQWLTFLLEEFKVHFQHPATLYCNNKFALHIVVNLVFHERTKHIEINCYIVQEKVMTRLVKLLIFFFDTSPAEIYTSS